MARGAGRANGPGAGVVSRLDAEWEVLAHDPSGAAACRRWGADCPALAGTSTLAAVLERVAQAPDQVLGALLAATAAGDLLAGRVVLQAMLGKAVAMAARDRAVGVDDYVGALWCRIATYPLDARPRSVPANLALDTLKAVCRERRPGHEATTDPVAVARTAEGRPDALVGPSGTTGVQPPGVDEVVAAARRHRLVDAATGALLLSVYADGLSGRSAAERHATSPGAVRVRCSRAVRLLARHAAVLAEAA